MEPRPWNISITQSDSLVRVDVQTMGKRWKCCGEIRRERRCGSEDDGDSAIHYVRYIYIDHIMIIICKTAIDNTTTINKIEIIIHNI